MIISPFSLPLKRKRDPFRPKGKHGDPKMISIDQFPEIAISMYCGIFRLQGEAAKRAFPLRTIGWGTKKGVFAKTLSLAKTPKGRRFIVTLRSRNALTMKHGYFVSKPYTRAFTALRTASKSGCSVISLTTWV